MTKPIHLHAYISGVKYEPDLCKKLNEYTSQDFLSGMCDSEASFYLYHNNEKYAVSKWVSPKRTRSYPFERVYNTMGYSGKIITLIPVVKDEGYDGDIDYLQWDTVSFMSLLNVYVIPVYYNTAEKNPNYDNKITNQTIDKIYVIEKLGELENYKQSALHWNINEIGQLNKILEKAINAYNDISELCGVRLHSEDAKRKRLEELKKGMLAFREASRMKASVAQNRELYTIQPKEKISGKKATITIENYLGGLYYFTCDEVEIKDNMVYLIEAKHSKSKTHPSQSDIKDGLFKMILYTNLDYVKYDGKNYPPQPVLKLTSDVPLLHPNQDSELIKIAREGAKQKIPILVTYNNERIFP